MDLASFSIRRPVYPWLIMLGCLLGGIWGLGDIGRLEDPAFTIKEAKVFTAYPGASAEQVEQEVTEKLETAIQELDQLDEVRSVSRPGLSDITVEIKDKYDAEGLAQVWDELRRKINDASAGLPAGARPPQIIDDFGDVYGIFYAVTGDGYTPTELREIAKAIRRELLQVDGVAKIELGGEQSEVAYLNLHEERLAQLGYSLDDLAQVLEAKNAMPSVGEADIDGLRPRIWVDNQVSDVEAINNLLVGEPGSTGLLRISDIADVDLAYEENPGYMIRHNGKPAVTLAISGAPNTNIVDVGAAVSERLALIKDAIPLGIKLYPIYDQPKVVKDAVNGFLINLFSSVAIVTLVLCLAMGWRSGIVVGTVLGMTVMGTLLMMNIFGLELQRISLGALIIAMGMLADNAIVVAEGMLIGVQRGRKPLPAAQSVIRQTLFPLLGSTIIGIMAFSGIGLSQDSVGEFLFSLFAVMAISLLLSWILAITVTPYMGAHFYKQDPDAEDDPYHHGVYQTYRRVLVTALKHRGVSVLLLVVVTVISYASFGLIKQGFFPASNTPMFYMNYWLPQGSSIHATSDVLAKAEEYLLQQDEVDRVSSFIGQGASRFMLTYNPESGNPAYGQLIVRTHTREQIPKLLDRIQSELIPRQPQADVYMKRLMIGPGGGADLEVRFSGPNQQVLRNLGEQASDIFRHYNTTNVRLDWRQQESTLAVRMNEERARFAGVGNADVSRTLQFATNGYTVGDYEHRDRIIPIVARIDAAHRNQPEHLEDRLVWSPLQRTYIPMGQVVDRFELVGQEAAIARRDRVRTLSAQADVPIGDNVMAVFGQLRSEVEAIELPPGYRLEWGGEYENTVDAQTSLGRGLPLGFLVMIITTVLLFGTVREPIMIWLVVPMCLIGVVIGLLSTGMVFGFMSLLGVLSLTGMLIKNAVVLVDEIQVQIKEGKPRFLAVQDASVSRLRPVVLAAVTTVLGMIPLIFDVFFADMAVTIMGGLTFATVLTLIAVPVFYTLFHRITPDES